MAGHKESAGKKEILLTGRVELVQGGAALIYREPVLVDGKLWGLLSRIIDLASFQKAAFSEAQSDRFEFAIRTENRGSSADSAAQDGGPLYGNQNLFADPTAVILVANMPNDKWIYAVRSKDRPHSFTYWAIRCAGWLLSAVILPAAGRCHKFFPEKRRNFFGMSGKLKELCYFFW